MAIKGWVAGLVGLAAMLPMAACGQAQKQPAQRSAQPSTAATAQGGHSTGMTLQDFTARVQKRMLAADIDGDGKVSKSEFLAMAKSGKADPAQRFAKLDRNGDGFIDQQEIAASAAHKFGRLDKDGNGLLTREERATAKKAKAGARDSGA